MRPALRLLPLPLCIALSLSAHAADERPEDWRLCPIEDAVPAFADAQEPVGTLAQRPTQPTDIEGDAVAGIDGQTTTFDGNVSLRRGDQFLGTDRLVYDSETGRYVAEGSVRYQDSGMRLVAQRAEGDQNTDSHKIEDVRYQLMSRRGSGGAKRIEMQGSQGVLHGSTYSTCPPDERLWELRAQQIDVDTEEGMGVARNATLRIGKVPVLYVPWLMFPIDDRRRTGLLYPSIGTSNRNGFDWRQPIYLNLAPNYDMTLTPRFMSERGLMLGTEFRYLTETGRGSLEAAFLPSDQLTDRGRAQEIADGIPPENRRDNDRGQFRFTAQQNLSATWQARTNLNWISDPRYLEDFSSTLDGISSYQLSSSAGIYGR
ncbi:MAG: LPS assembly protein LptD, partial [Gammaproteobacteria bacterium]|nr:LPS assembly protein LptD [Gammaproteobacteria bacterium]